MAKDAHAPAAAAAPALSDEQVGEVLQLLPEVDSVELKLTLPESQQLSVVAALGIDALDAQIRQVFFFDTPELALNDAGVVIRARRVQRKGGDAIVKLRPVVPGEVSKALRKDPGFNIEVDAMPGGFVCSGTLKRRIDNAAVRAVGVGAQPLISLLSKKQRAFAAGHAPDGVDLDDLALLGPILVLKLKFDPEGMDRRLVGEMWLYPDGSRVLELSTKCEPGQAFQVAAELRAFLAARGVDRSGEQQTKTKKALEFFAGQLRGPARGARAGADC
jgi:hypothetical protein